MSVLCSCRKRLVLPCDLVWCRCSYNLLAWYLFACLNHNPSVKSVLSYLWRLKADVSSTKRWQGSLVMIWPGERCVQITQTFIIRLQQYFVWNLYIILWSLYKKTVCVLDNSVCCEHSVAQGRAFQWVNTDCLYQTYVCVWKRGRWGREHEWVWNLCLERAFLCPLCYKY